MLTTTSAGARNMWGELRQNDYEPIVGVSAEVRLAVIRMVARKRAISPMLEAIIQRVAPPSWNGCHSCGQTRAVCPRVCLPCYRQAVSDALAGRGYL